MAKDPQGAHDETKAALLRSLSRQREHILGAAEGLSDEQLRTPKLPSEWSILGLVRHLALDVEHYWFQCIVGGAPLSVSDDGDDDATKSWRVPADMAAHDVLALYRSEIKAADAVIERTALDAAIAQRDSWWGEWEVPDLRFVLLHTITETACHAGHADAVRELIDGSQWVVL
jgi:uncharacterized damage-inducible protein DinB